MSMESDNDNQIYQNPWDMVGPSTRRKLEYEDANKYQIERNNEYSPQYEQSTGKKMM